MKAQSMIILAVLGVMAVFSNAKNVEITPQDVQGVIDSYLGCVLYDEHCTANGKHFKSQVQDFLAYCIETSCPLKEPIVEQFVEIVKQLHPEVWSAAVDKFSNY